MVRGYRNSAAFCAIKGVPQVAIELRERANRVMLTCQGELFRRGLRKCRG